MAKRRKRLIRFQWVCNNGHMWLRCHACGNEGTWTGVIHRVFRVKYYWWRRKPDTSIQCLVCSCAATGPGTPLEAFGPASEERE